MNNTANIRLTIDSFLEDETSVLVLKGSWGVGKTYFWEHYVNEKKEANEIKNTAYSYVSLFGLNNLDDLKLRIFHNGKAIKSEEVIKKEFEESVDEMSKLYRYAPWLYSLKNKVPFIGSLTKFGKELPFINKVGSLIGAAEYGLVKNYLICFDDLERKGDKLSIKEVMGLIDELSTRKKCKIVLIFNDKTLADNNQDRNDFDKYREKVVDVETEYKPSVEENLRHIFKGSEMFYGQVLKTFKIFGLSNIRIFKKTKWALDKIEPHIGNLEKNVQSELASHIAVFCWSFYNSESGLPLSFVKDKLKANSWLSALADKEHQPSKEDKRWKEIASTLELGPAKYDDSLYDLIQSGYFDTSKFLADINSVNKDVMIQNARQRLHQAWEIYTDSFDNNIDEFKVALKEVLNQDIGKLGIWDFSGVIDVLEEYGDDVTKYVNEYVIARKGHLGAIDEHDHMFGHKIKNELLIRAIHDEKNRIGKDKDLDAILQKISFNKSWGPDDLDYLVNASTDDITKWMLSRPSDLVEKIRGGFLFFAQLQGSNPQDTSRYHSIANKAKDALKRVAAQNSLNAKRVMNIYGVDISAADSINASE